MRKAIEARWPSLCDAKFHSADEISIEGLLEEQWREGRHAMKNR